MTTTPSGGESRCAWATGEFLLPYHDEEWGVPVHDDRRHFEFLVLEAAQAGLSWLTVLKRREGYRQAFRGFDPEAVARFTKRDIERALRDPGIIRNRQKVESTVANARALIALIESDGSFDDYLWGFVGGTPVVNEWTDVAQIPAKTELSERLSKDLRSRGISVRRSRRLLLAPASGRTGQRPPDELLQVAASRARCRIMTTRAESSSSPCAAFDVANGAQLVTPLGLGELAEAGRAVEGAVPRHVAEGA